MRRRYVFVLLLLSIAVVNCREEEEGEDPPCTTVNPLCTCSSPGPIDLGMVTCSRVPLHSVINFNASRIFMLHLRYNQLSVLGGEKEEAPLANTGIWRISINHNFITSVSPGVFKGLERSLRELSLAHNRLHHFPTKAIQHLTRLQKIDLTDNYLVSLQKNDLSAMESSLEELVLQDNHLVHLQTDTFAHLRRLKVLNLNGNRLSFNLDNAFRTPPPALIHLHLSNNRLTSMPFAVMASVDTLKTIDLSHNVIRSTNDVLDDLGIFTSSNQGNIRIEQLYLDSNAITKLPAGSFRYFSHIGRLTLDYNPIELIGDGAFWSTKLNELSMRSCSIQRLSVGAFRGIEHTLRALDLSHNVIDADVAAALLTNLTVLERVALVGTNVGLLPTETFANCKQTLQHLRLESTGKWENSGGALRLSELQKLKNIRLLGMSQLPTISLSGFEFRGQSSTIETLSLRGSNVRGLEADAFRFLAGLRTLDLMSNHMDSVHPNAFRTIGHSLETLDMSDALHPSVTTIGKHLLQPLINVRHVSLSNNRLKYLDGQLFETNYNLRSLNLEDNLIEEIQPGTFDGDYQTNLRTIRLSFNRLQNIGQSSFIGLDKLKQIDLNDNRIKTISKNAFVNLPQLEQLHLKGNLLSLIESEALQNLPRLRRLQLAYNRMETLNFELLDQLGALANLQVNMSHNRLVQLRPSSLNHISVNIKVLDLSYNRVNAIDERYFEPIRTSVMQLYLSHNQIQNITKNMLQKLVQLQTLYLDNNRLIDIHEDAFFQNNRLQLLSLNHNMLVNLPSSLLRFCSQLHMLDLSKNRLTELPLGLFNSIRDLNSLSVASNRLSYLPVNVLKPTASSIRRLDLSNNRIDHVTENSLQPFVNLLQLDLSSNDIHRLNVNGVVQALKNLQSLSISNNRLNEIDDVESQSLEQFYLKETSIARLPYLKTPNLLRLDVSRNKISEIYGKYFQNSTNIRQLDISGNRLHTMTTQTLSTLSFLLHLNVAYNPLSVIANNTFTHFRVLNSLEIQGIYSSAAIGPLKSLRSLSIDHSLSSDTLKAIADLNSLEELSLHIKYRQPFSLSAGSGRYLPSKLSTINLIGPQMSQFADDALKAFAHPNLTLRLRHTSVPHLPKRIFNGHIRQLQLDLSDNSLVSIEDMVTSEEAGARGLFLMSLQVQDNVWKCDSCENVGWMENWMRQLRQKVCPKEAWPRCMQMADEMRVTLCSGDHMTVLDVLQDNLECDWKSRSSLNNISTFTPYVTFIVALVFCRGTSVAIYY